MSKMCVSMRACYTHHYHLTSLWSLCVYGLLLETAQSKQVGTSRFWKLTLKKLEEGQDSSDSVLKWCSVKMLRYASWYQNANSETCLLRRINMYSRKNVFSTSTVIVKTCWPALLPHGSFRPMFRRFVLEYCTLNSPPDPSKFGLHFMANLQASI